MVGGALIDGSAAALFVPGRSSSAARAADARLERAPAPAGAADEASHGAPLRLLVEVLRRDGARQVLLAQVLWVGAYAALAPFMVLYAEDVLGLKASAAGVLLAVFGVLTGAGMLLGARPRRAPADDAHGRRDPARRRPARGHRRLDLARPRSRSPPPPSAPGS